MITKRKAEKQPHDPLHLMVVSDTVGGQPVSGIIIEFPHTLICTKYHMINKKDKGGIVCISPPRKCSAANLHPPPFPPHSQPFAPPSPKHQEPSPLTNVRSGTLESQQRRKSGYHPPTPGPFRSYGHSLHSRPRKESDSRRETPKGVPKPPWWQHQGPHLHEVTPSLKPNFSWRGVPGIELWSGYLATGSNR